MIILGADLGLANLGYALVDVGAKSVTPIRMGVIITEPSPKKLKVLQSEDNVRRALEVSNTLDLMITDLDENIDVVCVEAKSFPRNASSAAKTAITWGILIRMAGTGNIPILQAYPTQIKQKLCGRKSASKRDVQQAVDAYFGTDIIHPLVAGIPKTRREHPYDALGAAVTCLDNEILKIMRRV